MGEARKANTTATDAIWRDVIEKERTGEQSWRDKWGWILEEYKKLRDDLHQVKRTRQYVPPPPLGQCPCHFDSCHCPLRTTKPHPQTTTGEVGWLSTRKEFQLEIYGPYPYCERLPINPPGEVQLDDPS